jgi:leader peptidase (prepilin peptidase)/N-methyltransferase
VVRTTQQNVRRIRRSPLIIGLPQTAAIMAWSAVAALLIFRELDRAFLTFAALTTFTGLLALSIIDAMTHRVPRYITGLMIVSAVPLIVIDALVHVDITELLRGCAGAVGLFIVYSLIGVASRGGFGRGDVMLSPSIGFLLANRGWEDLVRGTAYSFVLAGVVSAVLVASRQLGRRDHIAFVPYIAVGTLLAVLI